ncbi:hypothetical protein ACWDYJ_29930 [Streptomyces sp. NPDC003042]
MVTARPPRAPRARASAGLLRLLGLTVLLLGILHTHGADPQSIAGHANPGAPSASALTDGGGRGAGAAIPAAAPFDRHESHHPAHECVPRPPRPGAAVEAPLAVPAAVARYAAQSCPDRAARDRAASAGPAPTRTTASAVLQV